MWPSWKNYFNEFGHTLLCSSIPQPLVINKANVYVSKNTFFFLFLITVLKGANNKWLQPWRALITYFKVSWNKCNLKCLLNFKISMKPEKIIINLYLCCLLHIDWQQCHYWSIVFTWFLLVHAQLVVQSFLCLSALIPATLSTWIK